MQMQLHLPHRLSLPLSRKHYSSSSTPSIISIRRGTFYRNQPSPELEKSEITTLLFPNLSFDLPSNISQNPHWALVGPSNAGKTTLLEILQGRHYCLQPKARSFPFLASDEVEPRHRNVLRAIQYVGFEGDRGGAGRSGARGAYLSARYESRREDTDFTVLDYLQGNTSLNPAEEQSEKRLDQSSLDLITNDLRLGDLLPMSIGNLSNGQIRRARIAKALLGRPLVLLLDEPFMGLDPPTTATLSPLLHNLAERAAPRLILSFRPQDPLPNWITHVIRLGAGLQIESQGPRDETQTYNHNAQTVHSKKGDGERYLAIHPGLPIPMLSNTLDSTSSPPPLESREGLGPTRLSDPANGRNIIEMENVQVNYGENKVLGNWEVVDESTKESRRGLWWSVGKGSRWGVFGPNGSGKTTLISLICSDHPLSYSLPIKIFGRRRLPQPGRPGISVFDIQARIGQSSPEIHAFFPRNLSIRQVIQNAWADTFLSKPTLTHQINVAVDACLRWFEAELNPAFNPEDTPTERVNRMDHAVFRDTKWADGIRFGDVPFPSQRVALFLRAIIKKPELVILDEAFSGMDEHVRDKCMLFLTWGETRTFALKGIGRDQERKVKATPKEMYKEEMLEGLSRDQTLICVSHIKEEVPGLVENWVALPEAGAGSAARFGIFRTPLDLDTSQWNEVWDI